MFYDSKILYQRIEDYIVSQHQLVQNAQPKSDLMFSVVLVFSFFFLLSSFLVFSCVVFVCGVWCISFFKYLLSIYFLVLSKSSAAPLCLNVSSHWSS